MKKEGASEALNNMEDHNQIPELPNDVMRMIFEELSTAERAPLGSSCKRFRTVDFETGKKKFDSIEVQWNTVDVQFLGIAAGTKYLRGGITIDSVHDSFHCLRLFRNACTEKMSITYHKSASDKDHYQIISTILRTVTYKKLCMHVNSNQECSQDLIGFFIMNSNMMNSQVYISWTSESESGSFENIRAQLMQLPRLDKFHFSWQPYNGYAEDDFGNAIHVIDHQILLHFARSTDHAEFGIVNCTDSRGILELLEIVCQSAVSNKFLSFALPNARAQGRKKMIELGLYAIAHPRFRSFRGDGINGFIDGRRRTKMEAVHSAERTVVRIGKMDAQGSFVQPTVSWT